LTVSRPIRRAIRDLDAVKIGEDDLAVIYSFDAALLDYGDKFGAALTALDDAAKTNTGVEDKIRALDTLTIEANQAYDLRENVLTSIG
jgi:hypothetical protein